MITPVAAGGVVVIEVVTRTGVSGQRDGQRGAEPLPFA